MIQMKMVIIKIKKSRLENSMKRENNSSPTQHTHVHHHLVLDDQTQIERKENYLQQQQLHHHQ